MVRVAPDGKETIINVGTGIEVAIRNEGEYRINWAKIDDKIYVHNEIHAKLQKKYDKLGSKYDDLNQKYIKFNEKITELSKEYDQLKEDRNKWRQTTIELGREKNELALSSKSLKTKLLVTNIIWLFLSLGLLGVIGYITHVV